jgi:hypothetical protein
LRDWEHVYRTSKSFAASLNPTSPPPMTPDVNGDHREMLGSRDLGSGDQDAVAGNVASRRWRRRPVQYAAESAVRGVADGKRSF